MNSVFRYINNTNAPVIAGAFTVGAQSFLDTRTRVAVLDAYIDRPLDLLIDGVLLDRDVKFATDSSGNTVGIVVSDTDTVVMPGTGGYLNRPPAVAGGSKMTDNSHYVTGANGVSTTHFKFEAESSFTAIRVWFGTTNTSGTMPVIAALVAATDTGAMDTVSNSVLPKAYGTTYNNLITTDYGWNEVDWDLGVASKTPSPALGASNSASYIVSNWISCKSLPRRDVTGARPMAVLRIANTLVGGVWSQGNGISSYTNGRGMPFYREMLSTNAANDGVTTITNIPNNPATGFGWEKYAWLEFLYDVPTRSVAIVGDSTHSSAYNEFGTSWALKALREVSTPEKPISIVNLSGSGYTHSQYLDLLDYAMDAGCTFTDIIFQGWSQNGFTGTRRGAQSLLARDMSYILKLRNAGVNVWMTTSYGVNGYSGPGEMYRVECLDTIRKWGASGIINLVDTDSIITDYIVGGDGAGDLKTIYNSGDNIHANHAGQEAMGELLKSVWS